MKLKIISFNLLLFLISFQAKAQDWEFVGLDSLVIFHLDVKDDTIYAGTWDKNYNLNSRLYFTSDGGSNWIQLDSSLGEGAILGLERFNNTIYIVKCPCSTGNAGTLYKTTNNGQNWESINNISNNKIRWMGISPFNQNEMYAIDAIGVPGGLLSNLYKSSNGGINWETLGPFPSSSHGSELSFVFDRVDSTILYVGVDDHFTNVYLFKSTDEGVNWFFVSSPPVNPKEIYSDYNIKSRLYLTPKPYLSTNGGSTWIVADSGLTNNTDYISFYQDTLTIGLLYNLYTDGLYKSRNDTIFWKRIEGSENLPLNLPSEIRNLKNIAIDETSEKIYLGTSSGIFRKNLITNLEISDNPEIINFSLEQNFPNPFNPATNIRFEINQTSFVTLKVYDLLGKEITTLLEKELSPDGYEVSWEGQDSNGILLPGGVYFIQMKTGEYQKTIKTVLLK